MTKTLTITAATTDAELEAIPFLDMRREAADRRDDGAALNLDGEPITGDETLLEMHDVDGVTVLWSPTYEYAFVNQNSAGIGDSLVLNAGDAPSVERAAAAWAGADA